MRIIPFDKIVNEYFISRNTQLIVKVISIDGDIIEATDGYHFKSTFPLEFQIYDDQYPEVFRFE